MKSILFGVGLLGCGLSQSVTDVSAFAKDGLSGV
jgi:hypothetical protein